MCIKYMYKKISVNIYALTWCQQQFNSKVLAFEPI